ncbi:ATP-binding protein [Streptomyces sp. SP17BM10]|uniref:ATP-binding protein n=1 Tax=Streptomyces sp. SP17BM10 TaxID=3002530 RepID=UPI003FCCF2E0
MSTRRHRQAASAWARCDQAACQDLRLPAFRDRFIELAGTARREQATYKQFLLDLLQVELADRDVRRQQRLLRLARFPRPERLEDFDFTKNPNVTPEVVADLKSPGWVREGRPLVLIGDSGTGKSHLLIGIGTAIAEAGLSVRYTTTSALVNELAEADAGRRPSSVIARYSKIDLLCLDEFGISTWTAKVPSCGSRFSRSTRSARPPRSRRTPRSPSRTRPSGTPASARPSPTGSPSAAPSSRQAPSPTGSRPPRNPFSRHRSDAPAL